jgi:hypothetical protein
MIDDRTAAGLLLSEFRRHPFESDVQREDRILEFLESMRRRGLPSIPSHGPHQHGSDEARIDGIDGEISAQIPRDGASSGVMFSWHTVEFLVRMVRKRDERIDGLLRHVTAALRTLTYRGNTTMLDGHPAVQDARRLLNEVADFALLDEAIAESSSITARMRMEAYRAGLADRDRFVPPDEWLRDDPMLPQPDPEKDTP